MKLEKIARTGQEQMIAIQAQLEALQKGEIEESGDGPWQKKGKKKKDWREGVKKFEKEREEEERDIQKRLDSVEDIEKGMDRFWNTVEEKEIVKKKPKVEAMMPKIPVVGRKSGFERDREIEREYQGVFPEEKP